MDFLSTGLRMTLPLDGRRTDDRGSSTFIGENLDLSVVQSTTRQVSCKGTEGQGLEWRLRSRLTTCTKTPGIAANRAPSVAGFVVLIGRFSGPQMAASAFPSRKLVIILLTLLGAWGKRNSISALGAPLIFSICSGSWLWINWAHAPKWFIAQQNRGAPKRPGEDTPPRGERWTRI